MLLSNTPSNRQRQSGKKAVTFSDALCAKDHPGHCREFHVVSIGREGALMTSLAHEPLAKAIVTLLNEADTVGKARPSRSTTRRVGLAWEAGSIVWCN